MGQHAELLNQFGVQGSKKNVGLLGGGTRGGSVLCFWSFCVSVEATKMTSSMFLESGFTKSLSTNPKRYPPNKTGTCKTRDLGLEWWRFGKA